ncbi:MAG TPA: flavodoxin family protein [Chloroflexia bacterium]|nr:flavodoxin family protein [Chloroflexia bacterium]
MKVFVICDTEYGNTWKLATEMAETLRPYAEEVTTVKAADALGMSLAGYDLLLVGGPTQGHGISPRVKAVLEGVPGNGLRGIPALAFDTRMNMFKLLTGAASEGIAHRLTELGATMLLPPESFIVAGGEGPLMEGELERAAAWVRSPQVLGALHATVATP